MMDNEGTNPPQLEFSWETVKLGIVEQHLTSFMEISSISLLKILNLGRHHFSIPLTH